MVSAIIVAGGKGLRMESDIRKQYIKLDDYPILLRTILSFDACHNVQKIFLVLPENDFEFCIKKLLAFTKINTEIELVPGGKERQQSVYNGLLAVDERLKQGIVLIHDGVRPFITLDLIESCIKGANQFGSCILGVPCFDTLKIIDNHSNIKSTQPRDNIWLAQTPQAFQYSLIRKAHDIAIEKGLFGTDDASLVEACGQTVKVIPGSKFNIKITNQEDLAFAKAIIELQKSL